MRYVYDCKGQVCELKDSDETIVRRLVKKMAFMIVCDKCCNVKVLHLLRRSD